MGNQSNIIVSYVNFMTNSVVLNNKSLITVIKDLEVLKNEAAEKKFPDNELLRKLSGVLKDIEHCQQTSIELLSDSTTRYNAALSIQPGRCYVF